jgi:hypothetical protein
VVDAVGLRHLAVLSVLPSSMISHSTLSKPGTSRGRQGIWMISFKTGSCGHHAATGKTLRL